LIIFVDKHKRLSSSLHNFLITCVALSTLLFLAFRS
jgi:hypothetical protein